MSNVNRFDAIPVGTQLRSVFGALAICVGGLAVGVVGLVLFPLTALLDGLGLTGTVIGEQLSGHRIQIGFAAFALAYLKTRDEVGQYVRIHRPTLKDVMWLIGIVVAVPILVVIVEYGLAMVGMAAPQSHGDPFVLYEHPAAIPALFVGLYLFAAPAEEVVYRGLIHGRLRDGFSMFGRVLIAGVLFGVMHLLVGFLTPSTGVVGAVRWGVTACVPGIVWGLAYERTDNLAVTVAAHAISWTIPVGMLLGL